MLETSITHRSRGLWRKCTRGELPSDEDKKHDCPRHVSNHFQGMFLAIFQSPLSFTCDPGEPAENATRNYSAGKQWKPGEHNDGRKRHKKRARKVTAISRTSRAPW